MICPLLRIRRSGVCSRKCGCPPPNPPWECSRQPEPVIKGAFGVPRDRLRRPLTEPVCRQVRQLSGSGEGPGKDNRALSKHRGDHGDGEHCLKADGRGSVPFGRDCCQYCCQAAGQRRSQVDGCGLSVQRTDRNGRSWTTCLSLRIRRLGVRVPPSAPAKPQVRVLPRGTGEALSRCRGP